MKPRFILVASLLALTLPAQERAYRPATQAEVNAGQNATAGVTPATLANALTNGALPISTHAPRWGYDHWEVRNPDTMAQGELGEPIWSVAVGGGLQYNYSMPLTMFYGKTNLIFTLTFETTNSGWAVFQCRNNWFRLDANYPVYATDPNRVTETETNNFGAGTNVFEVRLTNGLFQGSFAWPINATNIASDTLGFYAFSNSINYRVIREQVDSYPQP
jgi:hypothetical protein